MYQPFTPPSMYKNYQPPVQGSDLFAPVPGWGWPVSSAGPSKVGVGALGGTYAVHVMGVDQSWSIPVEQMAVDAVNAAAPVLAAQLPEVIGASKQQVILTVVQGALIAGAIGAVAILGYRYLKA
jgi:hypothetical protein